MYVSLCDRCSIRFTGELLTLFALSWADSVQRVIWASPISCSKIEQKTREAEGSSDKTVVGKSLWGILFSSCDQLIERNINYCSFKSIFGYEQTSTCIRCKRAKLNMHFSTATDRDDHSARWTEKLNGWQQEGVGRYTRRKSRKDHSQYQICMYITAFMCRSLKRIQGSKHVFVLFFYSWWKAWLMHANTIYRESRPLQTNEHTLFNNYLPFSISLQNQYQSNPNLIGCSTTEVVRSVPLVMRHVS